MSVFWAWNFAARPLSYLAKASRPIRLDFHSWPTDVLLVSTGVQQTLEGPLTKALATLTRLEILYGGASGKSYQVYRASTELLDATEIARNFERGMSS